MRASRGMHRSHGARADAAKSSYTLRESFVANGILLDASAELVGTEVLEVGYASSTTNRNDTLLFRGGRSLRCSMQLELEWTGGVAWTCRMESRNHAA
jgi:hypothetical protein